MLIGLVFLFGSLLGSALSREMERKIPCLSHSVPIPIPINIEIETSRRSREAMKVLAQTPLPRLSLAVLLSLLRTVAADIVWPEYSQQCRDDAGPPFEDDEPGVPYHDGSAAYPVLAADGGCAGPVRDACGLRGDYKTAYLEGPINCGNTGWYCRIFNDEPNWPNINLNGDVNFGQCNRTESFEGWGFDQDGHCHGSSYDSTYYWWIRDHWFRQYNGKVRCCCGWYQGGTQPVTQGRIANRCDYRRLVTSDEDLSACRDANEDHGLGFEDGCDAQYEYQIGSPIPENDAVCWEIERFGYTEEGGSVPTTSPTVTPKPTPPVVTPPPTPPPTVSESPTSPTGPPPTTSTTTSTSTSTTTTTTTTTTNPPPTTTSTTTTTEVPPPEEDFRLVTCGRGYEGCTEIEPPENWEVVHVDEIHEVRCCRDCENDGPCNRSWKQKCEWYDEEVYGKSKIGGQCRTAAFHEAVALCDGVGGRLCTLEEVLEECTRGTGCGFDDELIWACMYEGGGCEYDEECCSGICNEGGSCASYDLFT